MKIELDVQSPVFSFFPITGTAVVINSPASSIPSHGTHFLAQTYAYDICGSSDACSALGNFSTFKYVLGRVSVSCASGWGRPVVSPLCGRIIDLENRARDIDRLNFLKDCFRTFALNPVRRISIEALLGNYVIIEARECFFLLAHLRQGSLCVSRGDTVRTEQVIGALGNSGNTTFPHVHIQAMDNENLSRAHGIPLGFQQYEEFNGTDWVPHRRGMPERGSIVRSASGKWLI